MTGIGIGVRLGIGRRSPASNTFTFTVKTDNTGTSNNDQMTIPLYTGETYDFSVAYDGQETTHNTDADLTLTFPSGAGTYDVVITGTFAGIYFNNTGDRLKIVGEVDMGTVEWCRLDKAFAGCLNVTTFTGTIKYNSSITTLFGTWQLCQGATEFPDVSLLVDVTSLEATWISCTSATSFPSVSTLTKVTTINECWRGCTTATSFPSIATLSALQTMVNAWRQSTGCLIVPVLPSSSTTITTCSTMFYLTGSQMLGTVEEIWNATNFPNVSAFSNAFTGDTGLTNYADIPDGWKGL